MAVAPGPAGDPYLGHWRHMRSDTIGMFLRGVVDHGDLVRFERRGVPIHLFSHPDHVRYVLQENPWNFVRQSPGYTKIRTVVGNGLVAADGELWKRQRRTIQGMFMRERVLSFYGAMKRATREMLADWEIKADYRLPIDVDDEMMRLTLHIVTETLIGTAKGTRVAQISDALSYVLKDASERIETFELPDSVPTPRNQRFRRALATLHDVIDRTIEEHQTDGKEHDDLVARLMAAKDSETGEGMSREQLRDEIMTMFFVGHDSSAHALAWTFYLLSLHADVRRNMLREIDEVLGGREPTPDDLQKLKLTERVFKESMRLFPPVWILVRACIKEVEVGGFTIPGRSIVVVSPYVTHHHPRLWSAPEGFDPDRFLPEAEAARPRYAYFPFGGGPRTCLGYAFAMMEAICALAMISQKFTVDLVPGQDVVPFQGFTLSPAGGLRMKLTRRAA